MSIYLTNNSQQQFRFYTRPNMPCTKSIHCIVGRGGALVESMPLTGGCGFESRSSRHVETLGKSLTRSCLWRFSVKLRHSIRAVSGALLSSSGLEGEL